MGSETTEDVAPLGENRWSSEDTECVGPPSAQPTCYKQRSDEFKRLFKEIPESEWLILDYPCALQRDILLQGRLYLSENWLCFHSNVFRGTTITVPWKDIATMTREKMARLIPNAIQICTGSDKLFFSSFSAREKSYQGIFRMWQNTLMDKPLTRQELCQMVRLHYGNELGLNLDEMESFQVAENPGTATQASAGVRISGEEHAGKLERPTSLRLVHSESLQTDGLASLGVDLHATNSSSTEEPRGTPAHQRTPDKPLERLAPERGSKRSCRSLDLNANVDRVSGGSGSASAEDEEELCPSQTQGRLFVNRVFRMSAEKMFELLFTDSSFVQRFSLARKITGATSTPWKKDESGSMKRTLNYTITITNPLVGKFSTATETQTLYKETREGQYYLVDAEVYTHDVPYHDYFYTLNRFCIIHNSKRKCRLRVYTDVKYKKEPWGLVKSFITKNSWSGLEEYFRHLEAELLEEEAEFTQGSGDPSKVGALRRRRRTYSRTLSEHFKPGKSTGDSDHGRESLAGMVDLKVQHKGNISTIVLGMSFLLLILTLLNVGLFFKLWAMEDVAHRMFLSTKLRARERAESGLSPNTGFSPPLRSREEAHLLRTVLQDSIHLLEQLRRSLEALQRNLEVPSRSEQPH